MSKRREGFTLIELLVVIAIIGILAAMVFPVFARARESARKSVCLSNVKNITLAMQMYLADNNDTCPPDEHRQEVVDYLYLLNATKHGCNPPVMAYWWNPYLKWQVLLDEYVKNREVWSCPSSKFQSGATFIIPVPDFLGYLKSTEGVWPSDVGPCQGNWPNGWGGQVTDSLVQERLATDARYLAADAGGQKESVVKAFLFGIGSNLDLMDVKLAAVNDPVRVPVFADSGLTGGQISHHYMLAYPEICCVRCPWIKDACLAACDDPVTKVCRSTRATVEATKDPERMKEYTRHLGGVNVGYLDGHAKWENSVSLVNRWNDGELEFISK
jgi:prepilin-type N-terminal cleavage/methylation domain-containing protein/prepilin-type processing-associated H-X9-DG protein